MIIFITIVIEIIKCWLSIHLGVVVGVKEGGRQVPGSHRRHWNMTRLNQGLDHGIHHPSAMSDFCWCSVHKTQDTRQSPNSQGAVHHLLITMCTATKLPPPPPHTASGARAGATFVTRPRQEITVTDRSVAPWRMDFQRGAVDTQTSL